jgi:hypothetical protein
MWLNLKKTLYKSKKFLAKNFNSYAITRITKATVVFKRFNIEMWWEFRFLFVQEFTAGGL